MFRNVPMKTRLLISGGVSIFSVLFLSITAVYSLWQSELELERQINATNAIRHELSVDKMPGVIEASVLQLVLLGTEEVTPQADKLKAKMASDIQTLQNSITELRKVDLSEDIRSDIEKLVPVIDEFVAASQTVMNLALTDGAEAHAALPALQTKYEAITQLLTPLGKKIKDFTTETAETARAHDIQLLYLLIGFSVLALLVMARNVRGSTLTITRPIQRLREALREVAEGDLGLKVADRMRSDDFGDIAQDIDAVSDRAIAALDEQNALREENEKVIERLQQGLQSLSKGDFSTQIEKPFGGGYDSLRVNFNATVDNLNALLTDVVRSGGQIQHQSNDIKTASDNLSSRTETQAATLEETAAALEEMTASVNSAASNAREVQSAVENARVDVERSGEVVESAVTAMNEIESSSTQISRIIGVIDDIAFQTNLLALNAGVEAARAGEVGQGFAVVASEVRALAQRSSEAANEIKHLIGTSSTHVQDGVQKVDDAGQALATVVSQVTTIAELVSGISSEAVEQAQGLNEINIGVAQLDSVTQQNAAMVEQTGLAISSMNGEAIGLNNLVGQFTLRDKEFATPYSTPPTLNDTGWEDVPAAPDNSNSFPSNEGDQKYAAF